MLHKDDIINLYKKGYSINTIAKKVFLNNRYIDNMLTERESLKVVESIILDYTTNNHYKTAAT